MPAFKYEALDAAGKSRTGLIDAENAKAARSQLRAQALVPLAVTAVTAGAAGGTPGRFTRRVFDSTSLAVWTRQMAGLVAAGLPLERALTALADEGMKFADGLGGGGLDGISYGEDSSRTALHRDEENRLPIGLELNGLLFEGFPAVDAFTS